MIDILPFPSGPLATNCYLVICTQTKEAAIIDAPPSIAPKLKTVIESKKITPTKIILTHSHWDHIADCTPLATHFSCPVLVHEEDVANLLKPGSDGIPCWITIPPRNPDLLLKEGDQIAIGNSRWEVIHTPGHSPGSICLYCREAGLLLSGDTLFKSTIGNLSLPTCQPERMWPSLEKLAKLPAATTVYPGHGPSTAIGQEKWLAQAEEIFGSS